VPEVVEEFINVPGIDVQGLIDTALASVMFGQRPP